MSPTFLLSDELTLFELGQQAKIGDKGMDEHLGFLSGLVKVDGSEVFGWDKSIT